MLEEMESPVDLPGAPSPKRGLGWMTIAIAFAGLFLLATNAVSLEDWIDDMPPTPAQAQAAEFAAQWRALTDRIDLGAPRSWLHEQWKRAEAARF